MVIFDICIHIMYLYCLTWFMLGLSSTGEWTDLDARIMASLAMNTMCDFTQEHWIRSHFEPKETQENAIACNFDDKNTSESSTRCLVGVERTKENLT